MKLKRKLILMLSMAILLTAALFCFPAFPGLIGWYNYWIFYPVQWVRGLLFGFLPFSIGDIIYIVGGTWLLITLIKWVKYLVKFRIQKRNLLASFLRMINTVLLVYLLFIFGWGANYYKLPLREYWNLNKANPPAASLTKDELKIKNKKDLAAFDSLLVINLNNYAPHYYSLSMKTINERAKSYYGRYTDTKLKNFGLGVKRSFFGYFLERAAVEGYYNPFTGEGQIDNGLPAFVMPFLVVHEIAHQAGIAAEGDANLLSYALCTASDDSTFRYSAYLEIWLYTNNRLYRRDTAMAAKFESQLNKLTTTHIDTLEQLSKKYHNEFARCSSEFYDSYLKMQHQTEGIRSYSNVAGSAWLLEQQRSKEQRGVIHIP
jgi:Protein of unknown function (DUF3810)